MREIGISKEEVMTRFHVIIVEHFSRFLDEIGHRGSTKHVNVKLKCTMGYVQEELISLEFAQPRNQLATIFTKRVRRPLVRREVSRVSSFNRNNAALAFTRYSWSLWGSLDFYEDFRIFPGYYYKSKLSGMRYYCR